MQTSIHLWTVFLIQQKCFRSWTVQNFQTQSLGIPLHVGPPPFWSLERILASKLAATCCRRTCACRHCSHFGDWGSSWSLGAVGGVWLVDCSTMVAQPSMEASPSCFIYLNGAHWVAWLILLYSGFGGWQLAMPLNGPQWNSVYGSMISWFFIFNLNGLRSIWLPEKERVSKCVSHLDRNLL